MAGTVRGKWQNRIYISSIQRWKATGRGKSFSVWSPKSKLPKLCIYIYISESGQCILFHQPVKQGDWLSFSATFWGPENSCEVAMIWPTECLSMKKLCISTLDSLLLYPTKTCKKLIQKGTVSNKFEFKLFKHQNLQHRLFLPTGFCSYVLYPKQSPKLPRQSPHVWSKCSWIQYLIQNKAKALYKPGASSKILWEKTLVLKGGLTSIKSIWEGRLEFGPPLPTPHQSTTSLPPPEIAGLIKGFLATCLFFKKAGNYISFLVGGSFDG